MRYRKRFDVAKSKRTLDRHAREHKPQNDDLRGDRRDGIVYLYTPEIELTINVALATGRPILLRGPSGSGKSSLARNVAIRQGRRYYEEVITSVSKHTDLLWRFDLLRRFRDAQDVKGASLKPDFNYIEPRAIWWAFDPASAKRRGAGPGARIESLASDPSDLQGTDAVVLIDEIDKADPDLPNNLLVTLGSLRFTVTDTADVEVRTTAPPLVFITSNDERDLPIAFVRRCIVQELQSPDLTRMVAIASQHFGSSKPSVALYRRVAELGFASEIAGDAPRDRTPSTAEYLDAVRACLELGVKPSEKDEVWKAIVLTAVRKQGRPQDPGV